MTSHLPPSPRNDLLAQEAYRWWVELHAEDCSASTQRDFAAWLTTSPEHVQAYLQTLRFTRALGQAKEPWNSADTAQLIAEAHRELDAPIPLPTSRVTTEIRESRRHTWPFVSIAACLLAAIAVVVWMSQPLRYHTARGEQRSVQLADGSVVTLNTSSTIEVSLHKDRRIVRLLEGEALFEVAHDKARPFDVQSGSAVIRAVGTQFNVRERVDGVTVSVLEGRVRVNTVAKSESTHAPATPDTRYVSAAEQVVVKGSTVGIPKHIDNVAPITGWLQRRLVFDHEPLGAIAQELNRYNHTQIHIADATLYHQEITGVFRANDPDAFLHFLAGVPDVRIDSDGTGNYFVTLGGGNIFSTSRGKPSDAPLY